ncbi:MAG: hypothetical protein ACK56F_03950 [bacterium]
MSILRNCTSLSCTGVSLHLPTPGHLNSDLAAHSYSLECSGAGKPVFLVRDR